MSSMPVIATNTSQAIPSGDDEIDLRQLVASLRRHGALIAKVAGGALLLSAAYAFLSKPVWEGEFQIVLASKESKVGSAQALLNANPNLASLVGSQGGENKLETEVKILESPSVLKPVFDFVKAKKAAAGDDVIDWRYSDWIKDNLEIKLEKGTTVLNLSYRDSSRQLVVPTLQRISFAYQAYSGRDRERGIAQGIRYLDRQIERYRTQSVASLRRAQQFAIEQDLTALKGNDKADEEVINSLNIEAIRVQAANEIRNIDEQRKQLSALGNNPETLMYQGLLIPELAGQGLPQRLNAIDNQLTFLRAKFTDKEDSIRLLKEERFLLIGLLKTKAYEFLRAKRIAAQARLAAAERPKGVLIRYRELLREAARDEATLTRLESERQVLALEQARKQEPWELISTPTLLDRPVAPRKGRILALGLLAGLVAGSGAALMVDRRSGRVFAEEELAAQLTGPLLANLSNQTLEERQTIIQLMLEGPLKGEASLAIIPLGSVEGLEQIAQEFQRLAGQRQIILCQHNLIQAMACEQAIVITSLGGCTRRELQATKQQLALQTRPLNGWLLLEQANAG